MRSHPPRWRLHRLARASLLATLGLGAGALHGASGASRFDELFGCAAGGTASFVQSLSDPCAGHGRLGIVLPWQSPAARASLSGIAGRAATPRPYDFETVRSYFGPGDAWANPLMWVAPGEPMHGEVVRIGWSESVTYAPVLFPNAVFRRVEVGRTFLPGEAPPANGFSISPSQVTDPGFYIDRGAGSFAPVLTVSDPLRTLRADRVVVGSGLSTEGAMLISAGAVDTPGSFQIGVGVDDFLHGWDPAVGYLRLAAGGAGAPALRVGGDLTVASQGGGRGFMQVEAGQVTVGGNLVLAHQFGHHRAMVNLLGGAMAVAGDVVLADGATNYIHTDTHAGLRLGAARLDIGRDLVVGRLGLASFETLSGAVLNVGRDLLVGASVLPEEVNARFVHGGGRLDVVRDLVVGAGSSEALDPQAGSLVMEVGPGAVFNVGGNLIVGRQASATQFSMRGATGTVAGDLRVGAGWYAVAEVDRLDVKGNVLVGAGSGGKLVARHLVADGSFATGNGAAEVVVPEGGILRAAGIQLAPAQNYAFFTAAGSLVRTTGSFVSHAPMLLEGGRIDVGADMVISGRPVNGFGITNYFDGGTSLEVAGDLTVGDAEFFSENRVARGRIVVGRHVDVANGRFSVTTGPGLDNAIQVGGDLRLATLPSRVGELHVAPGSLPGQSLRFI